jgi:uncharacterized protein YjdB
MVANGLTASSPYTKNFTITVSTTPPAFIAVSDISGVPGTATTGTSLSLTGTVSPANATNKTITWAVTDAGTTGAVISGSTLTATVAGTVTVTATIANGLTASSPYTKNFTITVSGPAGPGSGGKLTITGLPSGGTRAVYVFSSGTDISTYTAITTAYGNGSYQAVGASLSSDGSFTLYTWSSGAQGGGFTGNGNYPVLLLSSSGGISDTANPMYARATVSFSNGAGTVSYSSFTAVVTGGTSPTVTTVTVSPATASVAKGGTQIFTATVAGTGSPAQSVTWTLSGSNNGDTTISADGTIAVAATETAASLTVRATSTADGSKYGEATVTVTESAPPINIPSGSAVIAINFEGPSEDIGTILSADITNDPYYDPAIPVLENGIWQDGSNPVKYHQFYAYAGTSYAITWNDSYQGDNTKSADVGVSAYWKATDTGIFSLTDSGWNSPKTFTADRTGIVVLKVEHYSGGNTSGTYAVKYTAPESGGVSGNVVGSVSGSLTVSVANAGSYGNFRWILDGVEQSETTGNFTINTVALDIGPHRLTVIAVKAGTSYSREVTFRVNG